MKMRKLFISALLMLAIVATSAFAGGQQDAASADAKDKVVFRYNNAAEPESLDPTVIEGVPEHNIYMSLFEGLVSYDPETLGPVPGVAKSWEVSKDALKWTFHLRDNAVWSDGTPITAQQFVDSWLRMLDPDTAAVYAYLPGMVIKGAADYNAGKAGPESVAVRALDDHTFQFELVGPAPYVLGMLPHYSFSVQPLHIIEKYGDEWTRPENIVSNGPFNLKAWVPQDKLVMVKSETYWDKENVGVDELVFFPIDDQNTATNMFMNGEVDWIQEVPGARLDEMKLLPSFHNNAAFLTYYYQFNNTKAPFNDARVRKALAMAIDRKELVEKVTREGEFPAYGITPPLATYPAVVAFKEDNEMAKKLLAEAGFPGGAGFPETTVIYNTSEGHKRIAEYVQQRWEEVLGIKVQIENQEWATFLDNRQNQNFDIARSGWQGDYVDPNTFLTDLLHSKSGNNDGKYSNPKYDALLEKASLMPAGQARLDVFREAEELAIGTDMGVMPFYYYSQSNWIDTEVWGGWFETIQDIHPFKSIYKK